MLPGRLSSTLLHNTRVRTVIAAVVVAVGLGIVSCGGRAPGKGFRSVPRGTRPAPQLGTHSAALSGIQSACRQARSSARVLCPFWLPGGGADAWSGGPVGTSDRCSYLVSLLGTKTGRATPFHVMFGGRCQAIGLATNRAGRWPIRPNFRQYLELIGEPPPPRQSGPLPPPRPVRVRVVARAMVGDERAIVVQIPHYPNAGIQEGHYAIVWNQSGDGYELSYHYARGDNGKPPTRAEIRALRAGAASMAGRHGE